MHYRFLRFPGGKLRALTFSYDDGCLDDIRLSDTLTKYGLKGTFNFTARAKISVEDAKKHILDNGHEIAVHGAEHMAAGLTPVTRGIRDVLDCRLNLEKTYNRIVRGMAYADSGIIKFENGVTYPQVKQYLRELGITYARTLHGDNDGFKLPFDWHAWVPTCHHKNPNLLEWADAFLAPVEGGRFKYETPRLFYIWGHSYEFTNDQNWALLDRICEKFAGRDDVWYATNGEIYEYVTAYQSLVFSADETIVYNPTLHTIWFATAEKEYVIQPGETQYI
ncbi:MAG: polysaccharide deacetylase family protein [Clostridia bacterium]|nr:polysaccharide deacetylase family protein [Clostridia bacterium]